MNIRRPFHPPIDPQALEQRLGRRVADHLTDQAERLPHDITERLRVAREQAVLRARRVETAAAVVVASPGAAALGAPPPWWVRAASVLPLLLLVVGLMLIAQFYEREEILAAADVDVALLADRVPPVAYSDPGFLEFLKQPEP